MEGRYCYQNQGNGIGGCILQSIGSPGTRHAVHDHEQLVFTLGAKFNT
jgi:hypothetical protein